MYVNLTPGCVGITDVPFEQLAPLAAAAGFRGIDAPVGEIERAGGANILDEIRQRAGLYWGSFGLPVEFRKDDAAFKNGMANLRKLVPWLAAVGVERCSTWLLPGHNELDMTANFDRHRRRLGEAARVLEQHGIRLGLEFVGPKTLADQFKYPFLRTMAGMLELCDAIGTSNMGLLLDSFHWYTSGATADDLRRLLTNEKIVVVHVNDARPGRSRDQQIDNERALPTDTGVIDLRTFLGCLRELSYDGPVATEPFMPELSRQPAEKTLEQVHTAMSRLFALA